MLFQEKVSFLLQENQDHKGQIAELGQCCFGQTAVEAHNGKRADGDEKGWSDRFGREYQKMNGESDLSTIRFPSTHVPVDIGLCGWTGDCRTIRPGWQKVGRGVRI